MVLGEDVKCEWPSIHVHGIMLAKQVLSCNEHLRALGVMKMYILASRESQN